MTAIRIVACIFRSSGVPVPAGPGALDDPPACLEKQPMWLQLLAGLQNREALQLLCDSWRDVPSEVLGKAEQEYNKGVVAPSDLMPRLAPGHLASSFRRLQQQFISQAKYSCAAVVHVGRGSWLGTFYYIAAGVGSGIAEAQQVRAPHAACVTARCPRANQMPLAHGHVLLYLEQLACVAGEVHLRRCL